MSKHRKKQLPHKHPTHTKEEELAAIQQALSGLMAAVATWTEELEALTRRKPQYDEFFRCIEKWLGIQAAFNDVTKTMFEHGHLHTLDAGPEAAVEIRYHIKNVIENLRFWFGPMATGVVSGRDPIEVLGELVGKVDAVANSSQPQDEQEKTHDEPIIIEC